MRMIDADTAKQTYTADLFDTEEDFERVNDIFDYAPTVEAVVVVRCKECAEFRQKGKYYNGTPFGYCYHWDYEEGSSPNEVDGDDFCSYGERWEDA